MKFRVHIIYFFMAIAGTSILMSCESNTRKATVIPPPFESGSKEAWLDASVKTLSSYIDRNIDVDINYFKRAGIYFSEENYNQALADINEAIDARDNVGKYYLLRGKVFRELNNISRSMEDVQRAEALRESGPDLYILLADLLQENKKFRDAERYLNRYMQVVPYDGAAFYVKGRLLTNKGDSLAGLEQFQKAIGYNPRMYRAYQQCIGLYTRLKNYPDALAMNDKAIARFPKEPELYMQRGDIYRDIHKIDSAITAYQGASLIKPDFLDAYERIGDLSLKSFKYGTAMSAYEKIYVLKKDYPEILPLLGYCYEKSGNLRKAKELYGQELEGNPENQRARSGMWRIRQIETMDYPVVTEQTEPDRILDTSRIKIEAIQPRRPVNIGGDPKIKPIQNE